MSEISIVKPSCLILSLGTSEPRVEVNGQWLLLKAHGCPELQDVGLYEACKHLLADPDLHIPVWYPITQLANEYAKCHDQNVISGSRAFFRS